MPRPAVCVAHGLPPTLDENCQPGKDGVDGGHYEYDGSEDGQDDCSEVNDKVSYPVN